MFGFAASEVASCNETLTARSSLVGKLLNRITEAAVWHMFPFWQRLWRTLPGQSG